MHDLIFNGLEAVCTGPVDRNNTVYIGQGEEEKEKEETVEEEIGVGEDQIAASEEQIEAAAAGEITKHQRKT